VVKPLPSFQPAIGKFRLHDCEAVLEQRIPLTDGTGAPYWPMTRLHSSWRGRSQSTS